MGLDRFANFISKALNCDGIEDIYIHNNIKKIVASHVIFDLNFLMYQEIISIENEINDIIKTILCLPFATNKGETLEHVLKTIFTQEHWKPYYIGKDLETLFDGFNEDEIIQKFLTYITSNININNNNSLSIIELVIYEKVINKLVYNINEIHQINLVQKLLIFYDGMPSLSKIIEQRRRRIKNYLESNQKKLLFKKYFDNLYPNHKRLFENMSKKWLDKNDDTIVFDYFKWIKNRFTVDKSIGPDSKFIKNLELFMNIKIKKLLPKIDVYINSGNINGESDLKIFKYIAQTYNDGDFCIHTTDSDFIHMILVQQTYYKIICKDINLSVIKYLKVYDNEEYVQILDANIIIKNIIELYNSVNNIKINNYKIIWDICLLFLFFGNDHLPSSLEIGPELGMEYFLRKHYSALGKNNIVNLNHTIILDHNNLKLMLEKINEQKTNNITKIILQRFFKINTQLVNIFVDKLCLDFNKILEFLKTFILFKTVQLKIEEINNMDMCDIRKKLYDNCTNKDNYILYDCFNLPENKLKIVKDNIKLIEDNIDYYSEEFMGLITYNKPLNTTNDSYQDLYNYISDKTILLLSQKYPHLYDYTSIHRHLDLVTNINNNNNSNDYIKKIYHLVLSQFGPMKDFHTDNLTFYKYNNIPSLNQIIILLKDNPNIITTWHKEISYDNMSSLYYLNNIHHYLLITPFISIYPVTDDMKEIIKGLDCIDNLWFKEEDFDYRNLDIRKFLEKYETLVQGKNRILNLEFL